MGTSPQTIPSAASPSGKTKSSYTLLQLLHFFVAVAALVVATLALLTRPDIIKLLGEIINRTQGVLSGPRPSFDPFLARILHGVQAATIFCFVLIHRTWLRQMATKLTNAMPVAQKTLEQFSEGWVYMWYGWVALYVWFFVSARWSESPRVLAVSDVLDVASGFAIWWCFLALDMPSVKLKDHPHRDRAFHLAAWAVGIIGAICASLGVVDRIFDLGHIGVVVGLYNALALAFLTGRLGSHYMKLHRLILLCLYLYSMLQLFYSFLPLLKTAIWAPLIFLLALLFKIAVAYAGYDMMQHGGLRRYLDEAQAEANKS